MGARPGAEALRELWKRLRHADFRGGFYAKTLEEAQQLAERVTAVTHNHPDGIRGAAAVSSAIFLAKTGTPKAEIRRYIDSNFYPVMFHLASIPKDYGFEAACSRSVPGTCRVL